MENTFTDWLMAQLHRDDPVGDLARDAARDPRWPAGATSREAVLDHLFDQGAMDRAAEVVYRAWDEYASASARGPRSADDAGGEGLAE